MVYPNTVPSLRPVIRGELGGVSENASVTLRKTHLLKNTPINLSWIPKVNTAYSQNLSHDIH